MYIYIYTHTYMYIYIYIHTRTHICVWIHTYMYIHVYIYIYIYSTPYERLSVRNSTIPCVATATAIVTMLIVALLPLIVLPLIISALLPLLPCYPYDNDNSKIIVRQLLRCPPKGRSEKEDPKRVAS